MQNPHVQYRNVVIERIQNNNGVVSLVAENLASYMESIRELVKGTLSSLSPLFLYKLNYGLKFTDMNDWYKSEL